MDFVCTLDLEVMYSRLFLKTYICGYFQASYIFLEI